jgi:hypothetical protein
MSIGPRDVERLERELARSPRDLSIMQQLMAAIKANKARRPDLVIKCGPALLARSVPTSFVERGSLHVLA